MLAKIKELFFTVIGLAEMLVETLFIVAMVLIMCAVEAVVLLIMLPFGLLVCIYKLGEVCYYKLKGENTNAT